MHMCTYLCMHNYVNVNAVKPYVHVYAYDVWVWFTLFVVGVLKWLEGHKYRFDAFSLNSQCECEEYMLAVEDVSIHALTFDLFCHCSVHFWKIRCEMKFHDR